MSTSYAPLPDFSLPGYSPSSTLDNLYKQLPDNFLRTAKKEDPARAQRYSLEACDLFLDYSRHLINDDILANLLNISKEAGLGDAITAQISGGLLNNTEHRAVLHTALRRADNTEILVEGKDIRPVIKAMQQQMKSICEKVHSGQWPGHTGKPIRHVINIGIGGSFLSLKVVTEALTTFHCGNITPHYISNIDPATIREIFSRIDPETSLFIIASKSFTSLETLANAKTAKAWLQENGVSDSDLKKHLIAVSCNVKAATEFGVAEENILPMWDWVGGRYSLWAAIGLIIALTVGYENFEQLLKGAGEMDEHFRTAPFEKNMPVIMAMLGIWYRHWHGAQSQATLSYDHGLRNLPDHLQQVDMESNGKCVQSNGEPVTNQTGGIIWGGAGTNDQHAYMQLIHQGTCTIPVDFIMLATSHSPVRDQHAWLFTNGLAQANALAYGRSLEEVKEELTGQGLAADEIERLAPHKVIPGNRPCSVLMCESLTPYTLGAMLALYEQKIFVQGIIWKINSFDQWGVELGKALGKQLYPMMKEGDLSQVDRSTRQIIERFRKAQS